MAARRMFSRAITGSGRFLRLSAEARALYYDLGMEADDDGFVEAFVRLRATGAGEEHLWELERAGLIQILDEDDLVVHIQDWAVNNSLRRDRCTPSLYREIYPQCVNPESGASAEVTQPETVYQPAETVCQPTETSCQPTDNQPADTGVFLDGSLATQDRLGKDREEKENRNQEKIKTGEGSVGEGPGRARGENPWECSPKTPLFENPFPVKSGLYTQKSRFTKHFSDEQFSISHPRL